MIMLKLILWFKQKNQADDNRKKHIDCFMSPFVKKHIDVSDIYVLF